MLAIVSVLSLFCASCSDDDEPTTAGVTVCPKATYQGKVVTTAFGVTLDPTDWEIYTDDVKEKSLSLVFGEFSIVVPMQGNPITRTIKECKIENVGYEYKDGVTTLIPGEFVTTDGVFATIKYNIQNGSITTDGMTLSMMVQPEGMPIPMSLTFSTFGTNVPDEK